MERSEEILRHWFGEGADGWAVAADRPPLWFGKNAAIDADLRRRFGPAVEQAVRGGLGDWNATPRGRLALILLLDQLTRNIHRDTPAAFSGDPRALELALEAIERGEDRKLRPVERAFIYLPFEHAEDRVMQQISVASFQVLLEEAPAESRPAFESFHDYAVRHQVIIERFGRFPHRNRLLGRESTPEEEAFLRQPGSSF